MSSSSTSTSSDPDTIFLDSLKTSIISIGVMILLSSILSYITIIIKSLRNPSFETNIDDDDNIITSGNIPRNKIVDILNIVTSSTSLSSRIQITSNLFNPSQWIKPSEVLQAYSLLFSVEPIFTEESKKDDNNRYFNHIYRAILAIPFLKDMYLYFNSPHIGRTPNLTEDLNGLYQENDNDNDKKLQWDTTISQYILYYLYSVISKSVNTNLFIYKMLINYISNWSETILFLLYAFFGSIIMYTLGIISTIVLFITSVSEIPKLFSDRTPVQNHSEGVRKIDVKWSINSLQFINPYRLFVVWLFGLGYSTLFLFLSFFIFLFTLFIPLSLTGKVSKYFLSIKDNISFLFENTKDQDGEKNKLPKSNFAKVNINLSNDINYFTYLSKFLYRNKNYIFYITIVYFLLDITIAYTTSKQLITFLIFIFIIWLLNAFHYSIDVDNMEILKATT
jgi:hypothetical protein